MTDDVESNGALDLDSPFWRFALRVYARAGVSPLCLALQDENDIDVNLLLFAGWCGSAGRRLTVDDIEAAVAHTAGWTEAVVKSLRQARRAWKEIGPDEPRVRTGRETLKSVELLSEQIVCAMLFGIAERLGTVQEPDMSASDPVRANLHLVLRRAGVAPDHADAASRLLVEACRAAG